MSKVKLIFASLIFLLATSCGTTGNRVFWGVKVKGNKVMTLSVSTEGDSYDPNDSDFYGMSGAYGGVATSMFVDKGIYRGGDYLRKCESSLLIGEAARWVHNNMQHEGRGGSIIFWLVPASAKYRIVRKHAIERGVTVEIFYPVSPSFNCGDVLIAAGNAVHEFSHAIQSSLFGKKDSERMAYMTSRCFEISALPAGWKLNLSFDKTVDSHSNLSSTMRDAVDAELFSVLGSKSVEPEDLSGMRRLNMFCKEFAENSYNN